MGLGASLARKLASTAPSGKRSKGRRQTPGRGFDRKEKHPTPRAWEKGTLVQREWGGAATALYQLVGGANAVTLEAESF